MKIPPDSCALGELRSVAFLGRKLFSGVELTDRARAKRTRRLLRAVERKHGCTLLYDGSTRGEKPTYYVPIAELERLCPEWFLERPTIVERIESLEQGHTELQEGFSHMAGVVKRLSKLTPNFFVQK